MEMACDATPELDLSGTPLRWKETDEQGVVDVCNAVKVKGPVSRKFKRGQGDDGDGITADADRGLSAPEENDMENSPGIRTQVQQWFCKRNTLIGYSKWLRVRIRQIMCADVTRTACSRSHHLNHL